jgi:transcriptional regulator with XRE-family HTH domain
MIHSPMSRVLTRLLFELRTESGMTQEEFGDKVGWSHQTVSAIEKGERMLLALELVYYLRPFGVSATDFMRKLEAELAALEEQQNAPGG